MAEQLPPEDVWTPWLRSRAAVREARDGQRADRSWSSAVLDLASNDYLGLSTHPQVVQAAAQTAHLHGAGARASRVVGGAHEPLIGLEQDLVRYSGRSAALVFSSGYTANLGLLTALGGPRSLIVLDDHAHASLIDGARLARSEVQLVPHGALDAVAQALRTHRETAGPGARAVVVMESVYSVLGDAAPLAQAAQLCEEHSAVLVVDEAHTFAAVAGGSAVAAAGLQDRGSVITTLTLSKSLGAQGGAVLWGGPQAALWRSQVLNAGRTALFDTALAPSAAGAARAALSLADEVRLGELDRAIGVLRELLAGHEVTRSRTEISAGAVQALRMRSAGEAVEVARRLVERGVAVGCFRPPSVPDGVSRIRLTAHADHTPDQLAWAVERVAQAVQEVES